MEVKLWTPNEWVAGERERERGAAFAHPPAHTQAENARFETNSSKESGTMAKLVDNLPIIWQQSRKCISISARDMGTLIGIFWQP